MGQNVKIVVDKDIPFIEGVFEPYAEVVYIPGGDMDAQSIKDADALIIRTRTHCDEQLLKSSKVRIIASATIGTDHIDTDWCDKKGIMVTNAPGCNAGGVMEYVFCALYAVAARKGINLSGKTMGIIGVGNVGSLVVQTATHIGFKTLLCDPPRAAREPGIPFISRDKLLEQSDIVSLHVPLNGETRAMCNSVFFKKMKPDTIFINTSRGGVVDETALKKSISKLGAVIVDTWCNEPDIDLELMGSVDIATPHIAGYSYRGKQNGTAAVVRSVAHYFGIPALFEFFPATEVPEGRSVKLNLRGLSQGEIASILSYNYPVYADDFLLRINPDSFDELRDNYRYRREFFVD